MIEGIPAVDFAKNWERIRPAFQNFVDRSDERWSLDYLVGEVLRRHKQVWKVNDWQAIAVTSVAHDMSFVTLEACAGDGYLDWYAELEETLEAWARALGAKRMFGMARPGWTKAFKAQGYREIHREFVKDL